MSTVATMALLPFNNVDQLRSDLSQVGIGDFRKWWYNVDVEEWLSATDYFEFGPPNEMELKDNLAMYLESESEHHVRSLKLCMNQRNKAGQAGAYAIFTDTLDKIFQVFPLNVPEGLNEAIQRQENYLYEDERYTPDPRTDYYKLTITTKDTELSE